jgi:hypothetical protein
VFSTSSFVEPERLESKGPEECEPSTLFRHPSPRARRLLHREHTWSVVWLTACRLSGLQIIHVTDVELSDTEAAAADTALGVQRVVDELTTVLVGEQTLKWAINRTTFGHCQFCMAAYARALSTHTSSHMHQQPTPPKHIPKVRGSYVSLCWFAWCRFVEVGVHAAVARKSPRWVKPPGWF